MRARRPDLGGRSTVFGTRAAVACEHPRAALAGMGVLDAGGTAADACVAMAACMAVLAPMTTGMGGDAFLLYYEAATARVLGADGSGRAPGAAAVEELRDRGLRAMPEHGGPTVTVPGAVRLWEDAASALGRLSLEELLEPARALAADGCPVTDVVARYWQAMRPLLEKSEAASGTFLPDGRAPEAGQVFRQPELADTLAAVAGGGADAFYQGPTARRLARCVQQAGGWLSEEDLASHETAWVDPISTDYRGVRVHQVPPPAQGVAALQMLNILEGFDLSALGPCSAGRIHLEAEAKKLAFEDLLARVGDPRFHEVPTDELVSKEHAARLRARLSPSRAGPSTASGPGGDTTYLCAVDAEGNGCSFINSLYRHFGSGIVAPGTGVCLHNRGNSFRLTPGHPNCLAPGKRPLHTIIPGLATRDGALWATFGVMGAWMQPQGHAQLLVNVVDHGMDAQEAVDHPRHRHEDGTLFVEGRVPDHEVARLRSLGHRVEVGEDYLVPTGGAQLIRILENGVRACGSDPRKDGCALAR
ncbi:gamma-glutamyltransferase [soil metagenome]